MLSRDEVVDRLGGDGWAIVSAVFGSCESEEEVGVVLDGIFQVDDNAALAAAIWHWIRV